jgi:hypothetical protein
MMRGLLVALVLLVGCGSRTDRVVCDHCYCAPWGSRDVTHPLACETLGRDIVCCVADSS